MSDTSGTTLISPTTRTRSEISTNPATSAATRRPSAHSASSTHLTHAHTTHHVKRRPSHHGHAGPSRRTSDGETGRRAAVAGLTMHAMAGPGAGPPSARRKTSGDRPLTKNSRSTPNLPRLSRTTSMTSEASQTSNASDRRSQKGRKRSGESVQVLSADDGSEGQEIEGEEEGWESGDGEDDQQMRKAKTNTKQPLASVSMKRAASDSQAATVGPSPNGEARISGADGSVDSALDFPSHAANTRRTTGFAGTVHVPDPEVAAQTPHGEVTHPYNDANHIMPAHQIKHQQSARSLVALAETDGTSRHARTSSGKSITAIMGGSNGSAGAGVEKSPTQSRVQQLKGEAEPPAPMRMRSTGGSGLPGLDPSKSPSFPFPRLHSQGGESESSDHKEESTSEAESPAAIQAPPSVDPTPQSSVPSQPRYRQASAPHAQMRHRYSNSSLRSIQSLRAPPHPLNSPTGYRSVMLPPSRGGSAFNSPSKGKRGPSMHHPPIAPPVVYKEVATGSGWDDDSDRVPDLPDPIVKAAGDMRKTSFSSIRSLKGVMGLPDTPPPAPSSGSGSGSMGPPQAVRRKTAMEVASAASKLHTTTDAVAYHHSLGYPSSSAESAHLISRFLPPKRIRRPEWEISPDQARQGFAGRGLTNSDYREAHESLVRSMRELDIRDRDRPSIGSGASTSPAQGEDLALLKGRNGMLVVSRGGWRGKTPFELSVERCLAQRPQRLL
ncbi:hypothetical protein BCR39DRAFT_586847 [Naematelia encephala]|uniref:Uncharacterized protein n=1 Tax=Naematelia encephala TaxID=71784 RepID=A0A1Y2BCF3_9TREE|nr:hypothetical protein BCR39DRAFT_586847 [Naematelia encephala]